MVAENFSTLGTRAIVLADNITVSAPRGFINPVITLTQPHLHELHKMNPNEVNMLGFFYK